MISQSDKRIYVFLALGMLTGIAWLVFQYDKAGMATPEGSACLISRVTGFPCPSCGTTRSAVACLHGDWSAGFMTNPFGILMIVFLSGLAILFLYDIFSGRRVVPVAYRYAENTVRKKNVAILLICLVLANWCWNIFKDL
jgi:hypothetical protein